MEFSCVLARDMVFHFALFIPNRSDNAATHYTSSVLLVVVEICGGVRSRGCTLFLHRKHTSERKPKFCPFGFAKTADPYRQESKNSEWYEEGEMENLYIASNIFVYFLF